VDRTPGAGPAWVGQVCTLTIKTSGATHLTCGAVKDTTVGTIAPAGTNRIHINLFDPGPGFDPGPDVYSWRVSGGRLTLTNRTDSLPDRVAAMEGVWKRK
jgi:hypothetical protein